MSVGLDVHILLVSVMLTFLVLGVCAWANSPSRSRGGDPR
jgi:hypothetical protein